MFKNNKIEVTFLFKYEHLWVYTINEKRFINSYSLYSFLGVFCSFFLVVWNNLMTIVWMHCTLCYSINSRIPSSCCKNKNWIDCCVLFVSQQVVNNWNTINNNIIIQMIEKRITCNIKRTYTEYLLNLCFYRVNPIFLMIVYWTSITLARITRPSRNFTTRKIKT